MGEMPPPYYPAPPKKSKTGLIIAIILGVLGLVCVLPLGIMGYYGLHTWKKDIQPAAECFIGMSDVQMALRAYADEHDGQLPNAATWQDDVRPYFRTVIKNARDRGPFNTFSPDGAWGCSKGSGLGTTGISFNSEVSGKKIPEIKNPKSTVLVFEVETPGKNLHEKYVEKSDSTSPKVFGQARGWVVMYVERHRHSKKGGFTIDSNDYSKDNSSDNSDNPGDKSSGGSSSDGG